MLRRCRRGALARVRLGASAERLRRREVLRGLEPAREPGLEAVGAAAAVAAAAVVAGAAAAAAARPGRRGVMAAAASPHGLVPGGWRGGLAARVGEVLQETSKITFKS